MSKDAFLAKCLSYAGYTEGHTTPFGEWYATMEHDAAFKSAPWCDMFLSFCADKTSEGAHVGRFAYTPYHVDWFKRQGRWHDGMHGVTPGDIVFYNWDGGVVDHVGACLAFRDGEVHTIEGNTDNRVASRWRPSRFVAGYGRPDYANAGTVKPPLPTPKPEPRPHTPIPNPLLVIDGAPGPKTWKGLQRILNWADGSGLTVDGDPGPMTFKALQRALNRGRL